MAIYFLIIISSGLFSLLVLSSLAPLLSNYFEPTYWRAFFWKDGFAFFGACLGLTTLLLGHIFRKGLKKSALLAIHGFSLGLCAFSLLNLELRQPVAIRWDLSMQAGDFLPDVVRKARQQAQKSGKPVLYYFYADWCPGCSDFERFVLGHPYLQTASRQYFKCRLDLTHIHRWKAYLESRFRTHAVPAMALESRKGKAIYPILYGEHVSLRRARSLLLLGLELK